jgi:hypothetical protein
MDNRLDNRRRWLVLVLVLGLVVAGGAWSVSTRSGSGPSRLTPADLTFAQEDYDGRSVETAGVVRRFGPEDGATRLHYVVEDKAANRVALVGGDPARYVDRSVVVIGRFRFAEDRGRRIEVERIEIP